VTPSVPGLREQKKQRTSDQLRLVALELFAAHGFGAVTVDDIVVAAEVSKTTFYRYFDSKEDVLIGTATEKLELMRSALLSRPPTEPALDAVRNAFLSVAERYEDERDRNMTVGRIMRTTPALAARNLEHQAAWEELLRDFFAARDGASTPGLRHCVLAATVVASLRTAMDYWVTEDAATDLPTVVDAALRVTVHDLGETG
jgi:AcrR family transcriptional regulator